MRLLLAYWRTPPARSPAFSLIASSPILSCTRVCRSRFLQRNENPSHCVSDNRGNEAGLCLSWALDREIGLKASDKLNVAQDLEPLPVSGLDDVDPQFSWDSRARASMMQDWPWR